MSDILIHRGVKGMNWGIRREDIIMDETRNFDLSKAATVTMPLSDYEKMKDVINDLKRLLEESDKTHQSAYENLIRPMIFEWIGHDFPVKEFDLSRAILGCDFDVEKGRMVYIVEIPV